MELSDQETATILAALRFWQQHICDVAKVDHRGAPMFKSIPRDLHEHFAEWCPLSSTEIDALCEKLNCS